MIALIALVLPLALAAAVSPMLMTEQTMLLAAPDGRRRARLFALGVIATLTVILGLLAAFGRLISLPKQPHLSDGLDIVIGVGLLLLAAGLAYRRRHVQSSSTGTSSDASPEPAAQDTSSARRGDLGLIGFGSFSMATNFTSLALITPIAKDIATSKVELLGRGLVLALVVAIVSLPVWLPQALTRLAPNTAPEALSTLNDLVRRHGAQLVNLALLIAGTYLTLRGVIARIG